MRPNFISISPRELIGSFGSAALVAVVFLLVQLTGAMAENSASPHQTGLSSLEPVESPDDTGGGSLLFRRADGGDLFLAPLVATEATIEIGGIIARSKVRQTFVNPSDQWLEGIYVFPLPENASVDRLEMEVGGRTILGVIKEREEARQSYEAARAQGQRAALLESERPNAEYTSLIAIDDTPVRPGEASVISRNVPINLPEGWNPDRVFGPLLPSNAGLRHRQVYPMIAALDVGPPLSDASAAFEVGMRNSTAPPVANFKPRLQLQFAARVVGPRNPTPRTSTADGARAGLWIPASEIDMSRPARSSDAGLFCE